MGRSGGPAMVAEAQVGGALGTVSGPGAATEGVGSRPLSMAAAKTTRRRIGSWEERGGGCRVWRDVRLPWA